MAKIDFNKVVRSGELRGDNEQDTELLKELLREAEAFLRSFDWCQSISQSYFGLGIGGVVAVFLFRIAPKKKDIDEWLWVVVGDLPPAYLVADGNPTPVSALEAYVEEMSAWVDAARNGRPVAELIPVNLLPSPDNAARLQKRLVFLRTKVMPLYAT
jgi:hypothetical protein